MSTGFDLSTAEVLDWEVQAVWEALDSGELRVSVHAQNEINLDALLWRTCVTPSAITTR